MNERSPHEQALCAAVARRAAALLDDLRLHVSLPTGGGNHAALDETRERLAERLRGLGATEVLISGEPKPAWLDDHRGGAGEPGRVPPTVVLRRPARRPHAAMCSVLVSGHLDTVHDPKGSFRALSIAADGKTAIGPGCVDLKGGLVIGVAALEALEECGVDADWTAIFNSDEETGSYHSEAALRSEAKRVLASGGTRSGAVGLVLEPALPDGSLVVERLGSGQFMLEATGRSAHVGRDFEKGVSAVTALAEALVRVAAMPEPARGKILNVGPLFGGVATNAVPDLARAWGNVRYPTKAIADEIASGLESLHRAGVPGVKSFLSLNRPAKPFTPEVERLALAARRAAEDLGQKLPFGKTGGVCDGNILQDAGLATIDTLGVRGGGLHTSQEWIELASLVERCQLLAVLIARLSAGTAG
jgi:glutamate carboxypeptidase